MESVINILEIMIFTKDNMWMVFQKVLVSTSGRMAASIKEISNKDWEVDMECGVLDMNNIHKAIRGTIWWIKNQVMVFTNGRTVGYIKEIFKTIIEMAMGNYLTDRNVYTEDFGWMANK